MATKIQVRRDTAANWTSANPTLSDGEIGYETDTGYMKIGDGTTAWSSLSYFTPGAVDGDNDTTYTIGTTQSGSDANVTLTGSDATNDTITLVAGTNLSLTVAGDNITAAVDTDLSNYDNTTSAFLTSATLDLSGESLGSLSDVDIPSPSTNDYLQYDGANWTAAASAAPTNLNDLDDVGIAGGTPSGFDLLTWTTVDGGSWTNSSNIFGTTIQFPIIQDNIRIRGIQNFDIFSPGGIVTSSGPYTMDFDTRYYGGHYFVNKLNQDLNFNFSDVGQSLQNTRANKYMVVINNNLDVTPYDVNLYDDERNGGAVANGTRTTGAMVVVPGNTVVIQGTTITMTGSTPAQAKADIDAAGLADIEVRLDGDPTPGQINSNGQVGGVSAGESILINGSPVDFSGNYPTTLANYWDYIADDINNAGITGISAKSNGSTLEIRCYTGNLTLAENGGTTLADMNFTAGTSSNYVAGDKMDIIYNPTNHTDKDDFNARNQLQIGNGSNHLGLGLPTNQNTTITFNGCPGIKLNDMTWDGEPIEIRWADGKSTGQHNPKIGRFEIYEFTDFLPGGYVGVGANGTQNFNNRVLLGRHWNVQSVDALTGDLSGSVFADDSTLLVDAVNGSIPAANLTGALPALDGSALTNISGLGISDIVDDTTPQLGGNLDLNGADITGTGNIDITGNITNTGDTTVTGTLKVDSGNNIELEKVVSGNAETIGKITATNGTVEYGEIEFKTGPDGYVNNSEINWYARIGGVKTPIFEIKGTSLGKSGFELNPSAAADVDFSMQGSTDPVLIFADSGDDRVGFGKIPTQGKVDVSGDVYATAFYGDGSNLTGISGGGGLSNVVDDTTPQLGGSLDVNGQDIVSVSNGNITLTPNGAGVVRIDGTNGIDMESGAISIKNAGAESYVRFYCESSNAHYTQLQSAPHADYSGNVTVTLPAIATRLVGRSTTDTLTNKTFGDKPTFESGVIEGFSDLTGATGVVAHDTSNGHIFRHTSIAADFTANFTNLGLTNDHGTMVSLMLVQGGTAYIPTAVQIGGAAQTILWQGGSAPSGTASGTDIVSFSITQSGGSYTVLGQLTSYS